MSFSSVSRLLLLGFTLLSSAVAAQSTFPSKILQASVGNAVRGGAGTLTLAPAGVSFDSPDFVFTLPADDITAVEFSGAREAFLTLVLDQQSKFPRAYPALVRLRANSIGQEERLLVIALGAGEPVDPAVLRARQFQAFIRAHRAEREQAAVGAIGTDTAHPSFGKTLHVALSNRDGLLTFFSDHLQYDNPDVSIHLALGDILGIEAAGSRETFLHVGVRRQSQAQRAYQNYMQFGIVDSQNVYYLPFVLLPSDPVAPAFRLAQDYAEYVDNVRAGREQAGVAGNAGAAPVQPLAAPAQAGTAAKREINRFDAGFLERHNPVNKLVNNFKAIVGVPGTLIVFDTGFGYASLNQPANLRPARLPYLENGYLKFFVPAEAVASARDVSVVRSLNGPEANNTYIAEIALDRNSPFYLQHRALMTESDGDNKLFFVFKSRGALADCLRELPHGVPARDSF